MIARAGHLHTQPYAYNPNTLSWEPMLQPGSGSGEGLTDTELRASDVKVSLDGEQVAISNYPATQAISAASLPLPTGAATAAKQDTGNTSLASVLTELQSILAKLNASLAVTGAFYQATQPVSGPLTDTELRAAAVPVSYAALLTELQAKADLAETQPVSLASVPSHAVTGPLTDTQLRASPVPVSGTVSANAGTDLNTSALAVESGGNLAALVAKDFATQATLASLNTKVPALGQALGANSLPVVIASDQSIGGGTEYDEGNISSAPAIGGVALALVAETIETYITNEKRPLSLTSQGRLRVSSLPAATHLEMFRTDNLFFAVPELTSVESLWNVKVVPMEI